MAMDAAGTMCVATSTGGLTNKLAGRIGDTPTLGAGFWAEMWGVPVAGRVENMLGGLFAERVTDRDQSLGGTCTRAMAVSGEFEFL